MPEPRPSVVIIGGGITGLSAAWEIQQSAGRVAKLTVLEADSRWGGKVLTQTMPGPDGGQFVIDAGPESFVTRKREIWDLVRELDLVDQIIDPGNEARGTYVLDGGQPIRLPLDPISFVHSPLLSSRGKLRLLAEPFIPRKGDDADESLADFVTRRLGAEALEKFIGPVLGGIYNANPETQSILVTAPIMRQMEQRHRSLFLAAVAMMRTRRRALAMETNPPPYRFISFRDGAEELIATLTQRLGADLRLNAPVNTILTHDGGARWAVLSRQEQILADAVILTVPANRAAGMVAMVAPEAAGMLKSIRHNAIGTISLAYRSADLQLNAPISGLMIPRREGRRIDAIVHTSAKVPSRAPAGYGLLRVFFGGGDPETAVMLEADLVNVVRAELRDLLGLTAAPVDYRIARWPDSYAQADVGHLERVAAIEAVLPPGLYVAGGSYRGLAVPDCVKQGRAAAKLALEQLPAMPEKS
jgi:oxygen-dependent protoporphyrinogen oxidase